MRIIAGQFKGRRLQTPTWDGLRPTSDRLRETLFNVLAPRIDAARVIDGYAGTGAIGIEALSRGAAQVTFVERDPRAVALIERNLAHVGLSERYAIIRAGFADAAARLGPAGLVILDPPYGVGAARAALEAGAQTVAAGGLLVLEHARRDPVPETTAGLIRRRVVKAGDSALSFYEREPSREAI
ncbi:MAG TPA: 16S rRNA (guanine(966)-N(2))-methyltransferase RsmD [Vicinamibacterales bacterium]|nr:16S rRNA (guanine(966)-N(2))-methyltransferase RsmD [Vicinamibacterales bacterium]